ncbi:GspE/PulE family protein [Vogesella sp. GCM10023246]|uniref:GspE/PulE family protein n=1 Tax=Vogesella oryzagri TaxID=3160864 RepID=A0ABV1M7Z3_9NEIS
MSQDALLPGRTLVLTDAQLRESRELARLHNRPLISILEERSGLSPEAFVASLAQTFHYPVRSMEDLQSLTPAFEIVPYLEAAQHECMLCRTENGALQLLFVDPFDADFRAWANCAVPAAANWCLVHHADLAAFLLRSEESWRAVDLLLGHDGNAQVATTAIEDISYKSISEDTSQVVKLVHSVIYDALKMGASDIHLEAEAGGLAMKYRVDGVLLPAGSLRGADLAEQMVSRVKVMSELDITERRIPQDGRFKIAMQGREVDFRVSIMPSLLGEDAVLRILDRQALTDQLHELRLDSLGFDQGLIGEMRRYICEPYGMVLVTGPTGSGKTTTLYAAVTEINSGRDKIITIEEPVEYQLPGVLQIQVNEKKGLSFARGLRSILRHDPDKILVGEIRDTETAQIAVQAALTGHLVFTTVHANNVFDVIGRFVHMGVEPYSFVSALNCIFAQRLVRLNCPHCSHPEQPSAALLAASGITAEQTAVANFRAGSGCGHCRGTGFKGRKAIGEMLRLTDEIRELIVMREPIRTIKEAARRNGTRFLREAAMDMVVRGETTLQEVNRVTFVA